MEALKKVIREVPNFPKEGILFYDITTLLKDAKALAETVNALSERYQGEKIDVVVAIDDYFDKKVRMRGSHRSQFFEWIPYNGNYTEEVPAGEEERWAWFRARMEKQFARPAEQFRDELVARYGPEQGRRIRYAEAFEICEYGRRADPETIERLFPR